MAISNETYNKSNKVVSVALNRFSSKYSTSVLECGDNSSYAIRRPIAQSLIDYLCDKFKVSRLNVVVSDRCRPNKGRSQTYGYYQRINGCGSVIVVYNRSSHRGHITSIKSFYDTLLHEFMHHYDFEVLKLDNSLHTSGFFQRIGDLKVKLTK